MVAAPRMSRITASTWGFESAERAIESVRSDICKKTSYDGSDARSEGQEFALFHGEVSSLCLHNNRSLVNWRFLSSCLSARGPPTIVAHAHEPKGHNTVL